VVHITIRIEHGRACHLAVSARYVVAGPVFETFGAKHLERKKSCWRYQDAVACFQKYIFARDGKGKALFREAEEWVEGRNADGIFSFDSVCEMLSFDPAYLRGGLISWKEKAQAQHTHAKVYQLAPQRKKSRRGVSVSGRSHQRIRRAASR
jgi:hypothetical protein